MEASSGTRRHALVIGIDRYPKIRHAAQLAGCRNDAQLMASILEERFGFEVQTLLDDAATREAILTALQRLRRDAGPKDSIAIHFSGHGSRIVDPSGRAMETLLPCDTGRDDEANLDITDQEVFSWIQGLETPNVTLIFDSCHAGGIVRDVDDVSRGVVQDRRSGLLETKTAFAEHHVAVPTRDLGAGASSWLPASDRYTLLAACKAEQRAREIKTPSGRTHGVMTWFLAEALRALGGQSSYRDLFEAVEARVYSRHREQEPQLEGAWDRALFGVEDLPPLRFFSIRGRTHDRVEVAGGTLHGLVSGSRLAVYPSGTHRLEDQRPSASLMVDRVELATAWGELTDEQVQVGRGDRAIEISRPASADRLRVAVVGDDPRVEAMASAVAASPLLEVVSQPHADLVAYALEPRAEDEKSAPLPELGGLGLPLWALTDTSSRLVAPLRPVRRPESIDQLIGHMESRARRRALEELEAPAGDPLAALQEVELLIQPKSGPAHRPEPDGDGRRVLVAGDEIRLRWRHWHDRPLHVVVLDLGLTDSIRQVYPPRGAERPQPPRLWLELGNDDGEQMVLFVPDELPFAPTEPFERGLETLILLISEQSIDADALLTAGPARSEVFGEMNGNSLQRLLWLALVSRPKRDLPGHRTMMGRNWTVARERFWLQRRST